MCFLNIQSGYTRTRIQRENVLVYIIVRIKCRELCVKFKHPTVKWKRASSYFGCKYSHGQNSCLHLNSMCNICAVNHTSPSSQLFQFSVCLWNKQCSDFHFKIERKRRSSPVRGDEARRFGREVDVTCQSDALDDDEELGQQMWLLSRQEALIPQTREEPAGRLHRAQVSAQDVGAEEC